MHYQIVENSQRLEALRAQRTAECTTQASELIQRAETASATQDYEQAKDCYIEAVDILMELGSQTRSRAERAHISAQVMQLLSRAEEMKSQLAAQAAAQASEEAPQPATGSFRRRVSAARAAAAPIVDGDNLDALDELAAVFGDDSPPTSATEAPEAAAAAGASPVGKGKSPGPVPGAEPALLLTDERSRTTSLSRHSPKNASVSWRTTSLNSRDRDRCYSTTSYQSVSSAGSNNVRIILEDDEGDGGADDLADAPDAKLLEETITQIVGKRFSFRRSTSLVLIDEDTVQHASAPVKKSLLPLLGYTLPAMADKCSIKRLQITSHQLDVNNALETSLATGLALLPNLVGLDLRDSGIGPGGCKSISVALASSRSLISLNLANNSIGDEGAMLIANPLIKESTTLRQLILTENNIGPTGAQAIRQALLGGATLYQLDLKGNPIGCDTVDLFISSRFPQMTHLHVSGQHMASSEIECSGHAACAHVEIVERQHMLETPAPDEPRRISFGKKLRQTFRRKTPGGTTKRRSRAPSTESGFSQMSISSGGAGEAVDGQSIEQIFQSLDVVHTDELVRQFKTTLRQAQNSVTVPNVLLVGQCHTGKSSVINSAFGYAVAGTGANKDGSQSSEARHYKNPENSLTIWDTKGLDPGAVSEEAFDNNVTALIERLNADPDPTRHIHVVWYVMDSPRWCDVDQQYCISLFHRTSLHNLPVIVLINKADHMHVDQLIDIRDAVLKVAEQTKNVKGIFPCVADPTQLERRTQQKLGKSLNTLPPEALHMLKKELQVTTTTTIIIITKKKWKWK